ncbi:ATP-grasp domain-containing protein [Curtobacterium sp. MCBD17_040]|uniref:ATP-grasp domain-containing protein n=1 Tax=Curtobacterium sp. MCBD17_040 TaxID=2175674 RepID=UPI000DA82B01|nr:ATP-grasp domain-containing protein [Curtobacterium sp. MCBD17_040]WIB65860.1 ATP-grasp domain-containing protein [Curtobacterium sp. MCBD17_040]
MPVDDADLFLSLPRRGQPTVRAEDHLTEERKANFRRTWAEHIEPVTQPGADDFEDFYEEAARLDAALWAFRPRHVWMAEYREGTARNLGTGEVVPLVQVQHLRRYGGQPSTGSTGLPELVSEYEVERYHRFQAFRNHAGRPLVLAGTDLHGDGLELVDAVRQVAAQGYREVVVKVTRAKYGIAAIDIAPHHTDADIEAALSDGLDWALVSQGGRPDAFLVQGRVPMRFEYRVFVVGGVPVTGAGCIEEHTPANHRWDRFDTRVREHRSDPHSPVVEDPVLVRRLVQFAGEVAKQWKAERPDLGTAVIDVALDGEGEPLVVEFNGLLSSGLYASDPRAVTVAVAADPQLPSLEERVVGRPVIVSQLFGE